MHGAAHRLGQAAGDHQAESDAGPVVRVAEPVEGQERPLPVGFGDAGPVIDHAQLDPVPAGPGRDQRRRRRGGVAQRVADQVRDDPLGDRRVGYDRAQAGRDVRPDRPRLRPEGVERVRDDPAQIRGPWEDRHRPGLQPAHVQQARGETGEVIEGLFGGGQQFLAIGRGQPGVTRAQAADGRLGRGQRPAQVMADRREQRRPPAVGLGRPGRLPGQAAEQDQPPGAGLSPEKRHGRDGHVGPPRWRPYFA